MKKIYSSILLGLFHCIAFAQTEFITTWKTDNPGTSNDNQITIPTFSGETYDFMVDWGDGTSDTNVTGDITHTYATPGTYQVSISGEFPRIYFNESGDAVKLLNIKNWGNIAWTSMESAFAGCSNLSVGAVDTPNLSGVTSLRRMFFYCIYGFDVTGSREFSNFNGVENFNSWNVSTITDMSYMFDKSTFNQEIANWDVSNVIDMSNMFFSSPFNQDISNWDVSSVQNMSGIFGSGVFTGDVTGWDVGNVTNMDYMFNSTFFDQDISSWDVSNVVSMRHMLSQCSFNQDISDWNVSNVVDMSNIFDDNDLSRENYDKILIAWSQLPSLQNGAILGAKDVKYCLGKEAHEFLISNYNWVIIDQGENCEEERPFITTWKTDNPGFSEDNQITIPTNSREVYNYNVDWGDGTSDAGVTGDITHTYAVPGTYQVSITGRFPHIFFNNSNADFPFQYPRNTSDTDKIISIDQWGTNRWISMAFAFAGCTNLDVRATDSPDFSKDIHLAYMFYGCSSLKGNESMADWDLSYISFSANNMFDNAPQFNQPIGDWDVSNIRYLNEMFKNATSFNQNLENWDIGKAERLNAMFDGSGISISNYDKILNGWSMLPSLQENVGFGAKDTNYCNSEAARQLLIDSYNWEILDAGKDCSSTYFITTWKTDNPGISADNQITIPTFTGETYNYFVDWGDGTSDTNVTGDITHTYAIPGTYQVSISGDFPRIYFNGNHDPGSNDVLKIISVKQWGQIEWSSFENAFEACSNLDVEAQDSPNLSMVSSLKYMFDSCVSLVGNSSFNNWNVSNVSNMQGVFSNTDNFNQFIGDWNMSNATITSGMFFMARSFNQPLDSWDVRNVVDMSYMFGNADRFNHPLNSWNTGNVKIIEGVFSYTLDFNQSLASWDLSSAENMQFMFLGAKSFNQPIDSWDVSAVTNMYGLFQEADLFNQPLNSWNTTNVINMSSMFWNTPSFNQTLENWNVSNVTSMNRMFKNAMAFNQDLGQWNVTNVGGMFEMFAEAGISLENYDSTLIGWSSLPGLQNTVNFNGGSSQFCDAESARQFIVDTYGWTIIDGGKVPLCNKDNDADGVPDHLDLCLDTRENSVVDEYGCEILAIDAIQVYALTPTCSGSSDGKILFLMDTGELGFNISIEGESYSDQFNNLSGDEFTINNLSSGMYTITVSIPEILFEQVYGVSINNLESLAGKRTSINTKGGTVVYEVSGSKNYEVYVNGEKHGYTFDTTGQQTIVLHNLHGQTEIAISGESDCQGIVLDSFFIGNTVQVYPTITSSSINVLTDNDLIDVQVFGMDGKMVKEFKLDQRDKIMDFSNLRSGIYLIRMQMNGRLETVKIIKR